MMFLTLTTAGCLRLDHSDITPPPQPIPRALQSEFADRQSFATPIRRRLQLKSNPKFSLWQIEIPAAPGFGQTNRTTILEFYRPKNVKLCPVIIVVPISGGSYQGERIFAGYFATHGMAAVLVHRPKLSRDLDRLEDLDSMLKQTVKDHMQVIDWLGTQPGLDTNRVGVFGASLGGIKGALLAAVDPRVKAAVLGLAGGDLPYIVTHTTEHGIVRARMALMENRHWTPAELQEKLKRIITFDPQVLAPYVDARKVMLVLAAFDTVVPFETGWQLRQYLGKPDTIILPSGHYTTALFIPYIEPEALAFFQQRFQ